MGVNGFAEFGDDGGAGDAVVGGDREGVAGVVVEEVEDFDVGAVGQAPVGEVGLPAFVGLFGGEADVGGLGSFLGLGSDHSGGVQVAADGVDRDGQAVAVVQVPGDGLWAVVEAVAGQFGAQRHDQVDGGLCQPGRAGVGAPGAGCECGVAVAPVAGHQLGDPALRHPVGPGGLGLAQSLLDNGSDDQTRFRHPPTVRPSPIPMS